MLESFNNIQKFEYKKLSPEEQKQRGILGRLEGIIADGKNPTRNGRKYPMPLWEKVFEDPLMKEKIENKVCLGELGHPEDRTETDITKAAICLAEMPKKSNDGKLYGVFDIIDTPCGRILKTLCDYGCNIGVSSRGQGDTYEDYNGEEVVDEDTYTCECWDAVLIPAVETARPSYVNESLGNKTLYQQLNEALDSAKAEDRKVMTEALDRVGVNYKDSSNKGEEDVNQSNEEAVNDGANLVKDLQEALKANADLSKQVTNLQEKLSVCYAKDVKNEAAVAKLKKAVVTLSEDARKYSAVKNQLASMKDQLEEKSKQFIEQRDLCESYKQRLIHIQNSRRSLNESIDAKNSNIKDLSDEVKQLRTKLQESENNSLNEVNQLKEELQELKGDSQVKNSQYAKKLANANALVEKYRKTAETAANRYIESKAKQLGVSITEIKNKLEENYTFDDVDKICEQLRSYKMNINKLPFNFTKNNISRVAMNESKQTKRFENPDDVLDENFVNDILNS